MGDANLLVVGGGNMGGVLARRASAAGSRVVVAEPDGACRAALATTMRTASSATEGLACMAKGGVIVLAIKPQVFQSVAAELRSAGGARDRLVISVMAGITLATLAKEMPGARVARAMPNLPASIGLGMTAVAMPFGANGEDRHNVIGLLRGVGEVLEITEGLMDAFTALAGSGPAYVFHLAEAMEQAAMSMGFDAAASRTIVKQTVTGAAALLGRSNEGPDQLRRAVTSPGGTTSAAMDVLERSRVADTIIRAIEAARDRGAHLGKI